MMWYSPNAQILNVNGETNDACWFIVSIVNVFVAFLFRILFFLRLSIPFFAGCIFHSFFLGDELKCIVVNLINSMFGELNIQYISVCLFPSCTFDGGRFCIESILQVAAARSCALLCNRKSFASHPRRTVCVCPSFSFVRVGRRSRRAPFSLIFISFPFSLILLYVFGIK